MGQVFHNFRGQDYQKLPIIDHPCFSSLNSSILSINSYSRCLFVFLNSVLSLVAYFLIAFETSLCFSMVFASGKILFEFRDFFEVFQTFKCIDWPSF
jgi:hypothetical protein